MSPWSATAGAARHSWFRRCSSWRGAANRSGKREEGTTVTDFDEEEIARKHTLSSSLAYAEWQKTKINIIDTPGFANFLSDAKAALRVAEGALVCVDAVAGVEVQTEKLWAEAAALNLRRQAARARRRGRTGVGGCRRRRRSADRETLGRSRRPHPPAPGRRQPPRTRARQPGTHPGVATSRLRARDHSDSAAPRRRARLHWRRRPRTDEGADLCR